MTKNAYYFSHDSNAARDPKILQMRSVYKAEGYGWYWMFIEMMREQPDYRLPLNKYAFNAFALQMDADAERLQCFVNDCVTEFGLFKKDEAYLWSESLLKRMELMDIKSVKARQSALERWGKSNVNNANAMQTHSERNAKKRKEKKVKESKEVYGEFQNVLLTSEEYGKLISKFGEPLTKEKIERLSVAIASKGYKYSSHYATILSWDRKDSKDQPALKNERPVTIADYDKAFKENQ